ncbi:MAG: integration host factor, partial [Actinomycetota bacterium]|nr:integration host factor [Actinomycetota bacterium]
MPLPPPLTEEQRRDALAKAAIARRKRAELKE